jgi:sialate O-acetylesterase
LGVPVGLINTNWGGTPAETWTPKDVVQSDELLNKAASELKTYDWWPSESGITYNAMIHPLTKYRIAGTIWYQGESNVGTHYVYKELFVKMIDSWRGVWGYDFPFYFVQIAPFDYGSDNINGALLREAQTKAASHTNTGMVVVSDLVDDVKNIHPVEKILVAERLANYALTSTYGLKSLPHNSPTYHTHIIEGDKIRVKFDHVPTGLKTSGGPVSEFYIAGNDGVFLPAEARIDGKTVIVHHKNVRSPKAVRYAFSNTAIGNLFSSEGLPVNLFRTDQ